MFFLPSILEYSTDELKSRLQQIATNQEKVLKMTNQKALHLHLDCVLPEFAKQREVETSLSPSQVLEALKTFFEKTESKLSIHLMGDESDVKNALEEINDFASPDNWTFETYLPKNHNTNHNTWYDLGEWDDAQFEPNKKYLLMTVQAGKSGQKLEQETKQKALEIVEANPNSGFILDGGWSIEEAYSLPNLRMVSYSSFWDKLTN